MNISKIFNWSVPRRTTLHIIDGDDHAVTMKKFASSILKNVDVDIMMHETEMHPKYDGVKMIRGLKENVEELSKKIRRGDFVAIPASASAYIQPLENCIYRIFGRVESLTFENLDSKRKIISNLINHIATHKNSSEFYELDMDQQGYEHLPDLIKGMNNLVDKGANVYFPAGHPAEHAIKYQFKEMQDEAYLYRYIASGQNPKMDSEGKIIATIDFFKNNKYEKINLLGLSKAHCVTLEGLDKKDYIFGAYHSWVTDRARGVYNFSPVRDNAGRMLGYSFQDTTTPEWSYEDCEINDRLSNLTKFVGLDIRDCLADEKAHRAFLKGKIDSNKIYDMRKILSEREIDGKKLNYLGNYINSDKNLVFDINSRDEVLFQKCNCEGSEKPSVVSMWGSCFATMNKIKEDIIKKQKR